MTFMRMGTRCVVVDDEDRILLSKRGDFGNWDLPGGRLDHYERLDEAAAREVAEETGLEVAIERPVGLYFQQGRARMNVLYFARVTGGKLKRKTSETDDNQFFARDEIPADTFEPARIDDALDGGLHMRTHSTDNGALWQLQLKLAQRWVQNLLSGNPEPTFPRFSVWAVAVLYDEEGDKVFSNLEETFVEYSGPLPLPMKYDRVPVIPRVNSRGDKALTDALDDLLQRHVMVPRIDWRWAGLWQNTQLNILEFVFTARVKPKPPSRTQWVAPSQIQGARGRNQIYIDRLTNVPDEFFFLEVQEGHFAII